MPEPVIDRTWPITVATLRKALGYSSDQGDADELALFAQAACELIDLMTGRASDPTRHTVTVGESAVVPIVFINSARETAKLWWQQSKNGPRGVVSDPGAQVQGPPMGAALPRKVEGWLADYPPPPGFGQPITEAE
ncbi:hypothetical protein [Microcella pacifica]|uniref:Phage gp6-like head-tail connector protein n=1 Tax=Microcella pacifica TaxID=2591847 RepID=A0A9E5ME74_9MICO|nr:hypothetical protein [Microcella pacifica]NHF62237.1 hypothetical protein [Microcella pacifica]